MSDSSHSPLLSDGPLDVTRWRRLPNLLIGVGAAGALLGLALDRVQFGYSWLVAFMFFLSLGLGSLFVVLAHHLFDASWSVPIRRFCEHLSTLLFPWMAIFFLPVALLAPRLYGWMVVADPAADHALHAKFPLFTKPGFYLVAVFCFLVWAWLPRSLRYWSLKQDESGAVECTRKLRRRSGAGIFLFAITLTLAAVMWMKGLMYEWFSTMYGVYYFAGSVWMTLGTVYFIAMVLKRSGPLAAVVQEYQFYFIGSLMFAFTVFYAYIHFSQYFIIWNANMPEETFWYVLREQGTWWYVGLVIIFGHFFLPFLALLRIDLKLKFWWMVPLCAWTWVMHYVDLAFNIHPTANPNGYPFQWAWLDLACAALIGGVLLKAFLKAFAAHPPYPLKDPRLCEAMGRLCFDPSAVPGLTLDGGENLAGAPQTNGGAK